MKNVIIINNNTTIIFQYTVLLELSKIQLIYNPFDNIGKQIHFPQNTVVVYVLSRVYYIFPNVISVIVPIRMSRLIF
jgi:hypothetical protein